MGSFIFLVTFQTLLQNLARENIQSSQQKMKEYYDRNTSQPIFEIGQSVWVYTPKQRRVYLRNCCIINLVRIELLNSRFLFIIVCVLKTTRESISPFMLRERSLLSILR